MFRRRDNNNNDDNDDNERTSLLPSVSTSPTTRSHRESSKSNRIAACCASFLCHQSLTLLVLAGVVGISWYFQNKLVTLSSQLQTEHERAEGLQDTLNRHEQVIDRFNSSITNSDVVSKLEMLEKNLTWTMTHVQEELQSVQDRIQKELHSTEDRLEQTVTDAQRNISQEVENVKTNVEQYIIQTQAQFSLENSFMIYQLAGTITVLTCLISMWHMTAHLRKFYQPDVQRKILAILWMSPIYAVTSWFSLVFHPAEGYLAIIKDGYEAYIIYQFLAFLIAVLGKGDRSKVVDLLARRADHLTPPFRLFGCCEILCYKWFGCCQGQPYEDNRALADAILLQCQAFALQFVFFRPFTTTGMVLLKQFDYYGPIEGVNSPTDYRSPQFWLTVIQNISIFVAFAGLLKFYHAVDEDLAWCRPWPKFLCIKGVVFMTFWQGLAISVLGQVTDVANGGDADEWAQSAQNFLICLEMLLFAIAHFYCFPTDEWMEGYRVKHSRGAFGDSIALGDFFQDIKLILSSKSGDGKKKKKSKPDQPTIMEEESETDGGVENGVGVEVESSVSVTTSVETNDDENESEWALARALEESLGAAGDDPDIIEAKNRLLASKILSPDLFDDEDLSNFVSSSDDDDGDEEKGRLASAQPEQRGDERPTESTALLVNEASTEESLKPSIFTTVAAIASGVLGDENAGKSNDDSGKDQRGP